MLKIGHRGWRGNYPENTMIGIQKAIDLGVDGIEIDVVPNRDKQLVVSHDPWMCEDICTPGGKQYAIYKMAQKSVEEHDCGQVYSTKFPHQQKLPAAKPLLQLVIQNINWNGLWLFLEIKSRPDWEDVYHPAPNAYCELIINEVLEFEKLNKIYFMSFDRRILDELKNRMPKWRTLLLFDEMPIEPINHSSIGPNHKLITPENMDAWREQNLEVFGWTVNELSDINKCKDGRIDGIISDYPNRLFG